MSAPQQEFGLHQRTRQPKSPPPVEQFSAGDTEKNKISL
jgi:hypothetical protein